LTQRLIACLLSGQNAQCHLTNLQTDLTSTVTFERTRQDTLTVIKRTVGGDGPFPFVSHSLGDFSLTTVNGEAQRSFGNLAPGLYDLSETVPTGWIQTSATCDNGDAPDNINLAPGQTVKCTFVNRYTSTIADIPTTLRVGIVDPRGTIARARWYGPMRSAGRR